MGNLDKKGVDFLFDTLYRSSCFELFFVTPEKKFVSVKSVLKENHVRV